MAHDFSPAKHVENFSPDPAFPRNKILGLGEEELQKLYDQLHGGDPAAREQVRTGLESDLKALSSEIGSTPEQLQQLKQESEFMLERLSETSSPEQLEKILTGFHFAQQEKGQRATFQKGLQDELPALKDSIVRHGDGTPASILAATGVLAFSDSEVARIQAGKDKEELDQVLRSITRDKTEKFFGKPTELDSEDILMLGQEIAAQHGQNEKKPKNPLEKIPVVGGLISTALEGLSAAKNLIYFSVVRQAADDLKISKGVLFRLGSMTVHDLRGYLAAFHHDEFAALDPKVADAFKLLDEIDRREDELSTALEMAIADFKQDGFRDEDRERLKATLTVENLSVMSILSYWYMDTRERENWLTHALSRIPAMKKVYHYWIKNRHLTMAGLGGLSQGKEAFVQWERDVNERFKLNLEQKNILKFEDIQKEFGFLDKDVEAFKGKSEKFLQQAHPDVTEFRTLQTDRDVLVRRYNTLAHHQYSPEMSRVAKEVVTEGKTLQDLLNPLQSRATSTNKFQLQEVIPSFTSEQSAFLNRYKKQINLAKSKTFEEWSSVLSSGWNERLVTFTQNQELWTGKFQTLREAVEQSVEKPFTAMRRGVRLSSKGSGKPASEAMEEIQKTQFGLGRARKIAGKAALPVVVLGSELYALVQGDVKGSEVGWDLLEAGAGFVPVAGTALDFKAAFTGKSLSGRELSIWERVASFGFGLIGAVADIGTFAFGLGYGLRVAINTARGAKTAKNIGKMGRFQSLVFRAGAKFGHAASIFKGAARERRLAHVVHDMKYEDELSDFLKLSRQHERYKAGKRAFALDPQQEKRLAELTQKGFNSSDLSFLQRRGFVRKGNEMWLGLKSGVYKKTLPKETVDKIEKAHLFLKTEEDALSKVQAAIQVARGKGPTERFVQKDFDEWMKTAKGSKDLAVKKQYQQIVARSGQEGLSEKLKVAIARRQNAFYAWKAEDSQLEIERMMTVRRLEVLDKVTSTVSRAGAPMAAIMLISAGNITPIDVIETGATVVGAGAAMTGAVVGEVLKDHTTLTSLESAVADAAPQAITDQSSVEDQIAAAVADGQRREFVERERANGVPEETVLAQHGDDAGFVRLGLQDGYTSHVIPPESIEYQSSVTI